MAVVKFSLSEGNASDAREAAVAEKRYVALWAGYMKIYKTREFAEKLGVNPIVSPKHSRKEPKNYDQELYKGWNGIEQFFLCYLKAFSARIYQLRASLTQYSAHSLVSSKV
jgi:hypothetical protein